MWRCVLLKFYMFRLFFVLMEWENTGWHGYDFDSFLFLSLFLVINLDVSLLRSVFFHMVQSFFTDLGKGFQTWEFEGGSWHIIRGWCCKKRRRSGTWRRLHSFRLCASCFKVLQKSEIRKWLSLRIAQENMRTPAQLQDVFSISLAFSVFFNGFVNCLPPITGNRIQICFNAYLDCTIHAYINTTILQVIKGVSDTCMCTDNRLLWPQIIGIFLSSG